MRQRTILFYTHAFAGGGAERVFTNLALSFAAAGDRVIFAVDFAGGGMEARHPNLSAIVLGADHRQGVKALASLLAIERPDASFSALGAQNIKHVAAALLARRRRHCVLGYHGFAVAEPKRLARLSYQASPLLTRVAARTICVSDALLHDMRQTWHADPTRCLRVYNPVPTALAPFRDEAAILAQPPLVVACGRLIAGKRFVDLVEAFALVEPEHARLAILGEGPERPAIEAAIARLRLGARVDLPGHVADPGVWYARARCVAIASASESFGLTAAEALAQGLAVVTTDCGGPPEVLGLRPRQNGTGHVVPVGNSSAISAALSAVLASPGDPGPRLRRAQTFALSAIYREYRAIADALAS